MIQAMKKLLGVLLALLLPMANAFAQPDLTVGNASGLPGATVSTDVSFTNNGAVVGMSFDITYDSALVTPGVVTPSAGLTPHTVATSVVPGVLHVLINPPLVNPLPTVNDGVMFTVSWTIAGGAAAGNTPLGLTAVVFSDAQAQAVTPGALTPGQITINAAPVLVPNVVGLTQAAASTAITNAGLVVGTVTTQNDPNIPAGTVISQNPAANATVAAGSAVNLVVSAGPAQAGGQAIPTLSEWALLLLSLFLGGMIWRNRRADFRE